MSNKNIFELDFARGTAPGRNTYLLGIELLVLPNNYNRGLLV